MGTKNESVMKREKSQKIPSGRIREVKLFLHKLTLHSTGETCVPTHRRGVEKFIFRTPFDLYSRNV